MEITFPPLCLTLKIASSWHVSVRFYALPCCCTVQLYEWHKWVGTPNKVVECIKTCSDIKHGKHNNEKKKKKIPNFILNSLSVCQSTCHGLLNANRSLAGTWHWRRAGNYCWLSDEVSATLASKKSLIGQVMGLWCWSRAWLCQSRAWLGQESVDHLVWRPHRWTWVCQVGCCKEGRSPGWHPQEPVLEMVL